LLGEVWKGVGRVQMEDKEVLEVWMSMTNERGGERGINT
jgi:hypothetical protein